MGLQLTPDDRAETETYTGFMCEELLVSGRKFATHQNRKHQALNPVKWRKEAI